METKMNFNISVVGMFLLGIILTGCAHAQKAGAASEPQAHNQQTLLEND